MGDVSPWIEVSFFDQVRVTGVITQGRDSDTYEEWVTFYNAMYCSEDDTGMSRIYVRNNEGSPQEVSVILCSCNIIILLSKLRFF